MKIIKKCYDQIGMFDSKVGELFVINNNIVLPVSNIQIDADFQFNNFEKIAHINYSYLVFIGGVVKSYKKFYYLKEKYNQYNFLTDFPSKLKTEKFELELVDILNSNFQYLWTIEAENFRLVIPEYGSIAKSYFDNSELDIRHFFNIELKDLEIMIG